jgi:hypothetical protein
MTNLYGFYEPVYSVILEKTLANAVFHTYATYELVAYS